VRRTLAIDAASFACAFCSCRKPPRASQRLLLTRHSTSTRCSCAGQLRACCQHATLSPSSSCAHSTSDDDHSTFSKLPPPSILRAIDLQLHHSMQLVRNLETTVARDALLSLPRRITPTRAHFHCSSTELLACELQTKLLRRSQHAPFFRRFCSAFTPLHTLHLPLGLTRRDHGSSSAGMPSALL